MTDAVGSIAALIAQGTGLQSFLSTAATGLANLTRETLDFVDAENRRPAQRAADERVRRSNENYSNAVRALRQEANRSGVNIPSFANENQLSEQSRDALTARANTLLAQLRNQANSADQTFGTGNQLVFGRNRSAVPASAVIGTGPLAVGSLTGPMGGLIGPNSSEARRALFSTSAADIQAESARLAAAQDAANLRAQQEQARRNQPQGARDTANVGGAAVTPTNQAALRGAQTELGVANESLRLLAVRFERLGQVVTREQQLASIRDEAGRIERQTGEPRMRELPG
jgi:hypothetical protein